MSSKNPTKKRRRWTLIQAGEQKLLDCIAKYSHEKACLQASLAGQTVAPPEPEPQKKRKRSIIQREENKKRKIILKLMGEVRDLRGRIFAQHPNLLRNLPREILKHVISFLDKRPLDYLIVRDPRSRLSRYSILPNDERSAFYVYYGTYPFSYSSIKKPKKRKEPFAANRTADQIVREFGREPFLWHSDYANRIGGTYLRDALERLGVQRCKPKSPRLPIDRTSQEREEDLKRRLEA